MASLNTSGSQTATLTTEHTLATITAAGTYALNVDLTNMVNAASPDVVELREYVVFRSGDAEVLVKTYSVVGAQAERGLITLPRLSVYSIKYTLTQTQGGAGRAFPWSVFQA